MIAPKLEFDAGFRAGALSTLQAWRQRTGLILFAAWALLCVPVGAAFAAQRPGDLLYWAPLVGGTAVLAYFHAIVDHEVKARMRQVETA